MTDARRYAIWPDPRSRSRSRLLESHSRGVDRQSRTGLIFFVLTVKIETRHPVEGSFGNEFSWIYNHCGVMAARIRKTRTSAQFLLFKRTILFRKFSSPHRSKRCVQISWNLTDGNSAKSCVIYLTEGVCEWVSEWWCVCLSVRAVRRRSFAGCTLASSSSFPSSQRWPLYRSVESSSDVKTQDQKCGTKWHGRRTRVR